MILAIRLRYIENVPYHGIMGLKDEFAWLPDDCDERFGDPANDTIPWGTGPAFCIACDHRWASVAPVGTVWLECPSCKAEKGHFVWPYDLPKDTLIRTCECGNQLFYLSPEGHLCPHCGLYQSYD